MLLNAWPFLISRIRAIGYRVIVAPDFMIQTKTEILLSKFTFGEPTSPNVLHYRIIDDSHNGKLLILFRVLVASKFYEGYVDEFGRRFDWIEGMVLYDTKIENLHITDHDLNLVHEQVGSYFRDIWDNPQNYLVKPSRMMHLSSNKGEKIQLISADYPLQDSSSVVEEKKHPTHVAQTKLSKLEEKPYELYLRFDYGKRIDAIAFGTNQTAKPFVFMRDSYSKIEVQDWDKRERYNNNGQNIKKPIDGHRFGGFAVSLDGNQLAASANLTSGITSIFSSKGNVVGIGNLKNDKQILTQEESNEINALTFSPNSEFLAGGCADRTIKLWSTNDGNKIKTFWGHSDRIRAVAFNPDGNLLASGSDDQSIRLWDVSTGKNIVTLKEPSGIIRNIVFSPDGNLLASTAEDNNILLWEIPSGRLLTTFSGHSASINSIAFSPHKPLLVSGSNDRTVKIWNMDDYQLAFSLPDHQDIVTWVGFKPTENILGTAEYSGEIKLWKINY